MVEGEVSIRVEQTYEPRGMSFLHRLYLAEVYPDGSRRYLRQIRIVNEPRIYTLSPVPGLESRQFAIKHGRNGLSDEANWVVTLLTLTAPDEGTGGTGTADPYSTDPGTYLNLDGGTYP